MRLQDNSQIRKGGLGAAVQLPWPPSAERPLSKHQRQKGSADVEDCFEGDHLDRHGWDPAPPCLEDGCRRRLDRSAGSAHSGLRYHPLGWNPL